MNIAKRSLLHVVATSLYLSWSLPVLSAEQGPHPPYPYSWWHAMPWAGFWWVFPLFFFLMMIVMFIFFMRGGGPGCMWRRGMMGWPGERNVRQGGGENPSESALEILNRRYARGEIDTKEYEEKRSAITRPD